MNKYAIILLCLTGSLFLLTGCPLETQKSIDSGSYNVPAFMNGIWWEITPAGAKKTAYEIQPDKTDKVKLRAYALDSAGKRGVMFHDIIMSSVGGNLYLNVREPGDDETPEGYYILQFKRVSDREFILTGLKENMINADATQEEIVHFLTVNKDKSDIFDLTDQYHYRKQ